MKYRRHNPAFVHVANWRLCLVGPSKVRTETKVSVAVGREVTIDRASEDVGSRH